jgi:phosphoglucosamine mutase
MNRRYFGTDGVRGPYGGPLINEVFAARLGAAAGRWAGGSGKVVIGRDTRASGEALAGALAAGLRAAGLEPISLGMLPTPATSRAVSGSGAALGAMVTASHNPEPDNGIKFFGPDGCKLTDEEEVRLEQTLEAQAPVDLTSLRPTAMDSAWIEAYAAAATRLLPPDSLRGWLLAVDTANGASCATSPRVFRALGAEVIGLGDAPNGHNINAGVGSEHPEGMAARVRSAGARLGVAHDGDGDRCVLCDERGEVLDGDEILTVLALHALARGSLPGKTLVVTVQSNLGVDAAVTAAGGRVLRTAVGDRYVLERMLAEGAMLGGESSGHIICREVSPTGDGLAAALKVIGVMQETGRPLSELRRALRKFPQAMEALRVRERKPLEEMPKLSAAIRALEAELGKAGRVLVRYSGTELKLRFLVEGPSESAVRAGLARLIQAARDEGILNERAT